MKTIILPTDFSDDSKHAIAYTLNLFGLDYQYILLHTYFVSDAGASMIYSLKAVSAEESLKDLSAFAKELQETYGANLKLKEQSMEGKLPQCCETIIKTNKSVFLIAMGTKGSSGLRKVLVGSNTASTIEDVDCPVLAIPVQSVVRSPRHIALATDYSEVGHDDVLKPLVDILENSDAALTAVHVQVDEDDSYGNAERKPKNLSAFLNKYAKGKRELASDSIEAGLSDFIDNENVDMLVLVEHHYGFFEALFHRSVTKKIAMFSKVPLLALQDIKH